MEKETKKRQQKKRLIKKILIGVGAAGLSLLTIRAIMRGKQKKNECQDLSIARETTLNNVCSPTPPKKELSKQDYNDEAVVRKCNKLLKKLWKSGNPDNKLYFDDEIYFDIKDNWFMPFITTEDLSDVN